MKRRTFLIHTAQTAAVAGLVPQLTGCGGSETPDRDAPLRELRDRYFLKTTELNPVTATYLGADGYSSALAGVNGRLRDWRPQSLEIELKFYDEIERERAAIDPATLSPAARIDHAVLGAQLGFAQRQVGTRRYYERAVDTYVAEPFRGVDWQIQGMTEIEGRSGAGAPPLPTLRGTEAEWQLVIERLRAIPPYLETAAANLDAGRQAGNLPDYRMVQRDGVNGSKANADYFRNALLDSTREFLGNREFAPAMLADVEATGRAAADAFERFAGLLLGMYDSHDVTDRFAVGEEEYAWRLRNCLRIDRSLEDLFAYGAEQVSEYEEKMFQVAGQVAEEAGLALKWDSDAARRTSVRAVMDHLSKDAPRNDDELFTWYREVGVRAVEYGRTHQLFDVPDDYRLEVTPTPPVLRSTIDAAYYPAPPFKRSGVGRFYLTPTGNDPGLLKLNNRASVATTAIHEGFPGHDWHYKYMTQHAAEISNLRWFTPGAVEDSSSMWEDSMASEGWGLYAEELMAEPVPESATGFYTPAERLYELQGQLMRAVRVRVDIGIHTGRMTFDEAVGYFGEHVEFYPGAPAAAERDPTARAITATARRAIYRYSKWPTQAITYNLGKREILALREALRAKEGAAFSTRAFHERLMRQGTIPVGFTRDIMLGG
jgi:uncharacterized protein (DUF885 family)